MKISFLLRVLVKCVSWGEVLGARIFGRGLYVKDSCIGCEKCIKNCPTENIYKVSGKIEFGWNCEWCMRCIYACPQKAISARYMKLSIVRDGYNLQKVISNQSLKGNYITANTTGYFKHFYNYVSNIEV